MKTLLAAILLFCFALPAAAQTTLTAGEWFIDTDPGFGAGTSFTITAPATNPQLFTLPAAVTATLPAGYHWLYGRVKDDNGSWGHTFRRGFEVIAGAHAAAVVMAEYAFNTDPSIGNGRHVALANPQPDGTWTFSIPLSEINPATDTVLYLRVRDSSDGYWSHTVRMRKQITVGPDLVSAVTGQEAGFTIYPNPASGTVMIALERPPGANTTLTLADITGKPLQTYQLRALHTRIEVAAPAGCYFLLLRQDGANTVRRIIVE